MIRRSKIKVRPAIRKSGVATPPKPDKTVLNVKCSPNNAEKSLPCSPINVDPTIPKKNDASVLYTNESTESVENTDKQPSENKVENHDRTSTSENFQETNRIPPKSSAQKSRRRKLVACPLTAKERPKFNSSQLETKQASVPKDATPQNSIEKAGIHQNDDASSQINDSLGQPDNEDASSQINDSLGQPVNEDASSQFNDSLGGDPVRNVVSEVIITDNESCEVNDNEQSKEYISMQPVNSVTDFTRGIPNNFSSEKDKNTPCKTQNNNLEVITSKSHKDNVNTPPQLKKKAEKRKSNLTMYRNMAKNKLKKLMVNQEDEANIWAKIDHNVISMSDLIYLNPPLNSGLVLGMNASKASLTNEVVMSSQPEPEAEFPNPAEGSSKESHSNVEADSDKPSSLPVPQIRIAEDGSVVVDEESLIMEQKKPDTVSRGKTVYEFGRETTVNQYSFRRRPVSRPAKWTQTETDKFYRCLCIVGAEFSMMSAMFNKRTADDLRRKYKRELKTHPSRVDQALMQQHLSKWSDDMFEPKDTSDEQPENTETVDVT